MEIVFNRKPFATVECEYLIDDKKCEAEKLTLY